MQKTTDDKLSFFYFQQTTVSAFKTLEQINKKAQKPTWRSSESKKETHPTAQVAWLNYATRATSSAPVVTDIKPKTPLRSRSVSSRLSKIVWVCVFFLFLFHFLFTLTIRHPPSASPCLPCLSRTHYSFDTVFICRDAKPAMLRAYRERDRHVPTLPIPTQFLCSPAPSCLPLSVVKWRVITLRKLAATLADTGIWCWPDRCAEPHAVRPSVVAVSRSFGKFLAAAKLQSIFSLNGVQRRTNKRTER